ncbi:16S rRNA (uracil(1498)-N(3))-methyltransferase [Neptunicella marina]|uniref:Ribosomal RNA small subunit methyltransferase E n=1 Tax=Neptunicella marina TaxID=2125989 RepID=A0A8J6J0X7_9ALTE|nr:16S rRNA (uracil(1498)-N(3))-methyltransferase [Neptunicella marina]
MRIPRIYHSGIVKVDSEIELEADTVNHLANVLRVKTGQPVVIFNGDGNDYPAELIDVAKRRIVARIDAKIGLSPESPLPIHLGQGVSKGDRMDFVLQKSVELGVTDITPLITERCNVKLNDDRWLKKHQQWQKIIIGACEQSGRNIVPKLHLPISLHEWCAQSTEQLRLTLHPKAEKRMADLKVPKAGVRLLIGPEGGLSEQEIYQCEEMGFDSVLLGPRILRTETAALTSISILQSHFGDL